MIKWFTFSRKSDDDFVIRIFKSEYVEIERQTRLFPEIETGGDLFGTFTHGSLPVIWFVTGPGKRATHNFAEFSQDPEYITYMQRILMAKYGIQYIGSWHSHHKLGLRTPSSGDVRNAQSYARRHNRKQTIEIIVTYKNKDYQNGLDVTPFFYPDAQRSGWAEAKFTFLPGMSPIRELERQSNTTPDNKLPVVRTSGNEEIIDYLAQKIKMDLGKNICTKAK